MQDVPTMSHHSTDEGPELSEELKAKFKLALEGKRELPKCQDCVKSQNFVQVINFLIPLFTEAIERMDRASQTMDEYIAVFEQLEERLMKARMLGDDGR